MLPSGEQVAFAVETLEALFDAVEQEFLAELMLEHIA